MLCRDLRNCSPMGEHHFVTLFDLQQSGFRGWDFASSGLIFVAIGVVILFAPRIIKALKISFFDFGSWRQKIFPYFFVGFAFLWTIIAFTSTYLPYRQHLDLMQNNGCRMVEGPVVDFVPMPFEGHANESFDVRGVRFSYSDYEITDAFNNSASHGGPIRAGEVVRICYDPESNAILRLAVQDFKGKLPDYSKGEMDFASPATSARGKDNLPEVPWTASLFIYLYFLEFAGRLLLYRPYLRTFLRMSAKPIANGGLPSALQDGTKIKLADTLGLWDQGDCALWLRPRGFNFLRVPLVIAKLATDPAGLRITDIEVRFSTGFIVVVIAFFWGAYAMFSTIPGKSSAPLFVLGIFAVIAIASFAWNARRQTARMNILATAALTELRASRLI